MGKVAAAEFFGLRDLESLLWQGMGLVLRTIMLPQLL